MYSKIFDKKLQDSLSTGELLGIVDTVSSFSQLLEVFGYSKKGQYIAQAREFLVANDVYFSHFNAFGGTAKTPDITKICLVCGKEFTRTYSKKNSEQKTCSYACSNTYFRSGENNPNFKDGYSSYRSRALGIYGSKCHQCGYNHNLDALEVHHIDGNRRNNDIDNLVVLCANCHKILHKELDPTLGNNK